MAITLKEIIAHVESLGFKHMPGPRENSEICLRFETESYVDTDGDHSLLIVCAISDEGRYLEVFAPAAYTTANCKYKAAMFACMLKAAFMTKHKATPRGRQRLPRLACRDSRAPAFGRGASA